MSAHIPIGSSFQLLEVVPSRMENSPAVARRYGMQHLQLFGWHRKAIARCQVPGARWNGVRRLTKTQVLRAASSKLASQ